MELKEILKELSVFGNDRPVPVEALAEAVRQKEEITPVLLDALDTIYKKVQEEDENVYDDPSYDLSYYGIFLLAQFQEQKAFPKLLQILRLDKDGLEIMLGDLLGYMGKMLYSTYNGDLSALKSVFEDDSLDPFARGAALEVLDGIYQDGRLSHEELTDLLREQLVSLGEGEDEEIFGSIVIDEIADNDLYELAEDVREAFRLEKIDTMRLGNFDGFFDYLYNETEDYHHTKLLIDTAQELHGWSCFKSSKPSRMDMLDWKVGRNDPCPCGSGKKFKKCCLPKQEEMKIKFSSIDRGIDWDKYPPIDRQGSRPGLSDFYSQDAIEVDHLAYQAFTMLRHPSYQQRKGKVLKEARELLWTAFERFQQICEANGLNTPEEFDQEHKLHYFSREWLDVLLDQLLDMHDERYKVVQGVLDLGRGGVQTPESC